MKQLHLFISLLILSASAFAQTTKLGILDEVIDVVGESVILKSDLDKEYYQLITQMPEYNGNLKCELFDQLLSQKLLLHKADLDSIVVADERLEYEINRRIEYYAAQAGGLDKLERYLGISIIQYKDEMRKKVRDQMMIQEAQNALIGDLKVSPTEVRRFFDEIPKDSIPVFSAEVEVAALFIKPTASKVADDYAKTTAEKLRTELISGQRDFCTTAAIYSGDPGSKDNCGDLGEFKRGQMVPEFEAAAFRLKKDSFSKVIKTKYGYHIIQMIERRGEIVRARHILIAPTILTSDHEKALNRLKEIRGYIKSDSVSWCKAVTDYGVEELNPGTCGFYQDPNIGSNIVEITTIDPDVALHLEKMKAGEISEPHAVPQMDGSMAYRILYLKSENPPHPASLERDYQKIAVYALEKKKQDYLDTWAKEFRKRLYIWIDEKYFVCDGIQDWANNKM